SHSRTTERPPLASDSASRTSAPPTSERASATATSAVARGEPAPPPLDPVSPRDPAVKQTPAASASKDASSRPAQRDRAMRPPASSSSKPSASAASKETTPRAASPAPAQVAVTAGGAYPFAIVDGGRVVSPASTSHRITIGAGRKISLVAPEYSLNQAGTIEDNGDHRVELEAPALGRLTIRSSLETCTVQIGQRVLGNPPLNNISIAAGSYRVDIQCPNGKVVSEFVNIVGGQSQRVI